MHLDALPPHPADRFDRILVCQCIYEDLRLITRGQSLGAYCQVYVRIFW